MRHSLFIFVSLAWLCGPGLPRASAQIQPISDSPSPQAGTPAGAGANSNRAASAQAVDGIAARIEDDILTESEVRELAAFQQLVDGKAKSRNEVIRELADQWIVRGEAALAAFPQPLREDVDRAYDQFVKQFPSPHEFQERCAAVGVSESAVHRILAQQLFLSRFLEYRFRPAAQVDDAQIERFYKEEFAPQLTAKKQAVPPLEDVEDTIREVLVQRAINDRATKWLDETRENLKLDIVDPKYDPQYDPKNDPKSDPGAGA